MSDIEISALWLQIQAGVCWCDPSGALYVVAGLNPAWPGPREKPTRPQPIAVLRGGPGIVRLLDAKLEDFMVLRPIPVK